jgi:hypothetical protein
MADKAIIASNEDYENRKLSSVDRALIDAASNPQAEGLIPITSMEQLRQMALDATNTLDKFKASIRSKMTKQRAEVVYDRYVNQKFSWRLLAVATWSEWGADAEWNPPTNQLAGMALCEIASDVLKKPIEGKI